MSPSACKHTQVLNKHARPEPSLSPLQLCLERVTAPSCSIASPGVYLPTQSLQRGSSGLTVPPGSGLPCMLQASSRPRPAAAAVVSHGDSPVTSLPQACPPAQEQLSTQHPLPCHPASHCNTSDLPFLTLLPPSCLVLFWSYLAWQMGPSSILLSSWSRSQSG